MQVKAQLHGRPHKVGYSCSGHLKSLCPWLHGQQPYMMHGQQPYMLHGQQPCMLP